MFAATIWNTLWDLVVNLATLFSQLSSLLMGWSLLIVWTTWWLWGVNWPRLWQALREGAWTGFVLLFLVGALVWSRIEPGSGRFLGMRLPSFWWQLGQVSLLAGYTFFLGWVQGYMNWTPKQLTLEPAAQGHDDHHGGHGHGDHPVEEPTHGHNPH